MQEETKRYLHFLALAVMLAVPVYAAETAAPALPGGGFQGPGGTVSTDTVAKALVAPNKTPDESGKIMVEIDHKVFAGRDITPESNVRLFGKLKKYPKKPLRVDVKVLQLLQ